VRKNVIQNLTFVVVFLFFALERFIVPILHQIIELISQTKYAELDSVIGSIGALSYGVIGVVMFFVTSCFSFYFWINKRKVSMAYCLKLIMSLLLGFTVAVLVNAGI